MGKSEKVGSLIRQKRKEMGLTQSELANMLDLAVSTISYYESGNIEKMKQPTIEKLSRILNVSPLDLLGLEFENQKETAIEALPLVPVPVFDPVSCGKGSFVENDIIDYVAIPETWARYGVEYFSNQAAGDSMEPLIPNGSFLVFEKTTHLDPGEIGAFSLNGEYFCKRLKKLRDGKFWLFSENREYEPIPVEKDDSFRVIGKLKFTMNKI